MADFTRQDLAGSRFEQVDLTGARFHNVYLTGATIRGAVLVNVEIDGLIEDVRVNGVDVVPLVEAELNRRYPDRAKMSPADADGYRQAWDILERLWQQTVDRARGMDPEMPDEVDVPRDRAARPSLDQVLALRADRMATVRGVLAGLTDATLAGTTEPVTEPGYPEPVSYPVRRCLQAILTEEWEHRLFAERDLDLLTSRSPR
jgi:uncharacterized protein YjbI with pentapeptide repeats